METKVCTSIKIPLSALRTEWQANSVGASAAAGVAGMLLQCFTIRLTGLKTVQSV
jgi:hypothetical protein